MQKIIKIQKILTKIVIIVSSVCLAAAIILAFANTIGRYGFGKSWEWAEELIRYLIIFISFFVSAPMIMEDGHIAMTILKDTIPNKKFQWVYRVFCYITTLIVAFMLCYWGVKLVQNTNANMKSYSLIFYMQKIYMIIPFTMAVNVLFSILGLIYEALDFKNAMSLGKEADVSEQAPTGK